MAVGDQNDIYNRFIQNLPIGWFGNEHPNLDAILQAFITTYYYQYNTQYLYLVAQQRIQTATGNNLDLISLDYLGNTLPRKPNESDDSYRLRILANVVQLKATRQAMIDVLTILTGHTPIVYEGWRDGMCLADGNANPITNNKFFTGGLSNFDSMGNQHTYGNEILGNLAAYEFSVVVYLDANQGLGNFPGLNNTGPYPSLTPTAAGNPYFGLNYTWFLGAPQLVTAVIDYNDIAQTIELTKVLGTLCTSITIIYLNSI